MPMLIAAAFVSGTKTPFVWTCSECDAVFSLERLVRNPTVSALERVNSNVSVQCWNVHPSAEVVGLDIEHPSEYSSQAALRVVREATEGK